MKNMSIPQKNAEVIPAFEITLPNQLPGYMLSQLLEVVEQHYGHNSSKVISDHMEDALVVRVTPPPPTRVVVDDLRELLENNSSLSLDDAGDRDTLIEEFLLGGYASRE